MNKIRTLVCILFGLVVAAFALPGVVGASSNNSNCPSGEGNSVFCTLVISAPESVVAGQPFTVEVFVTTNGSTLARSDPCGSKALVTLDVSGGDSFASYSARASGAVATFVISVASADLYTLQAFAGEEGGPCGNTFYNSPSADLTAISVSAGQPIAPCPPDEVCVQVTNNPGGSSAATLFADTGTFDFAFFEAFVEGQGCATPPTDPVNGVLDFFYQGTSQKTIVFALAPNVVNKGIAQFNICWESKKPFMVQGGGTAVFNSTTGYFVGFLPNCSPHVGPPCVLSKTGTQQDGAFFTVLAPAPDPNDPPGTGDPKGYP